MSLSLRRILALVTKNFDDLKNQQTIQQIKQSKQTIIDSKLYTLEETFFKRFNSNIQINQNCQNSIQGTIDIPYWYDESFGGGALDWSDHRAISSAKKNTNSILSITRDIVLTFLTLQSISKLWEV